MLFRLTFLLFLVIAVPSLPAQETVEVGHFFKPDKMDSGYTSELIHFMEKNPDIRVEQWAGLILPGGNAGLMMSLAGNTAPDIGLSYFHLIRNEIKQEFLYPLNEWIGEDANSNGRIDDAEAKWPRWKEFPPILRTVATSGGKIYGLPLPVKSICAVLYRTDFVEMAGLDPNHPPETWDEFTVWCRRLTDANKTIPGALTQNGQRAILIPSNGFLFLPWIQSAGGEPIVQYRTSPKTGRKYCFAQNETVFRTPDGEDLSREPSDWRCNFDSPEAFQALDFLYRLRWEKWVSIDGKPVSLKEARKQGLHFKEKDIVTGVARSSSGQRGESGFELLSRGEVVMLIGMVEDLKQVGTQANIDPSLLAWFPFPAAPGPKGRRVIQTQNHYAVMYTGVSKRSKRERDAVWRTLNAITGDRIVERDVASKVLEGMARFVSPSDLKRFGYEEYIRDIPPAIRKNFSDLEAGKILSFTEPWTGYWLLIDMALNNECLGIMLGALGEDFDSRGALLEVNRKANSGLMFALPESTLAKWRPVAMSILILVLLATAFLIFIIVKSFLKKRADGSRSVYKGYLPLLLIFPAVLLILLWQYYPLGRGLLMAFQDYRVTGNSTFTGLDNFINLGLDPAFWKSIGRTVYFVTLNMLFAFTAPIILAIMLTEIKHLKILFRTLFFLPQMTSGIVIALMWKLMYNPTPAGFFNQMIAYLNYLPFVNIRPQAWLQDPSLAMICCIIPTVWASMGMSSLLYLAALHSIPPDLYEAAEVDGAGFRSKLWNITLPTLMPLIIISFVGTFIATFQNMGNIFLLTFGGPGEATTVIGLKIWVEAYVNLRFGMATSMACLLGTLLIGLTYVQIRFLGKVEYKRASD